MAHALNVDVAVAMLSHPYAVRAIFNNHIDKIDIAVDTPSAFTETCMYANMCHCSEQDVTGTCMCNHNKNT